MEAGFDVEGEGGVQSADARERDGLNSPCARLFYFEDQYHKLRGKKHFEDGGRGNRLELSGNENKSDGTDRAG